MCVLTKLEYIVWPLLNKIPLHSNHIKEFTINSADTWERKILTIAPDSNIKASTGAIANDSGQGFRVLLGLLKYHTTKDTWTASNDFATSNQVNWMDSTSNNFYFTGFQVEVGDKATPFEYQSFADELHRCQRYYLSVKNVQTYAPVGSGRAWSGTRGNAAYYFPCEMRANPTISVANLSKFDVVPNGGNPTAIYNDGANLQSAKVGWQVSSVTNGAFHQFEFGNNTDGDLRFDSEL